MRLDIDELTVSTFSTGAGEEAEGELSYVTRICPQSYNTMCDRTCVTCYNGCETSTAGNC